MKHTNQKTISNKIIYFPTKHMLPYPNAATRQDKSRKVLDSLLSAASGAGIVTALLCIAAFF